jgi:hypothetical protein
MRLLRFPYQLFVPLAVSTPPSQIGNTDEITGIFHPLTFAFWLQCSTRLGNQPLHWLFLMKV